MPASTGFMGVGGKLPGSSSVGQLGSPMAPPPQSSSVLPSQSAGSYINQKLGGLMTGTGAQVGGAAANQRTGVVGGINDPDNAVTTAVQNVSSRVKQSNQNLLASATIQGQKRKARIAAEQAAASRGGGGSGANTQSAGGAPVGQAYAANGSLSGSRNKVMQLASGYLGSPYVLGGTTTRGIDCSGLIMMVYNQLGYGISRHSATWQGNNIPGVRTSVNNLRPGDIVAWKDGSHIAVYAGNGEIIEAANERVGTVRRKIWASPGDVYGIALRLPGE